MDNKFIKDVEKMIEPIDVGTIHFMQSYANSIPKKIQNKIISSSSKNNTYMPFIVEPYSLFLFHRITDLMWAKELLPDNYRLTKTKVFDSATPDYYCIFGTFNVRSSVFIGTRLEFYIIAENIETNLLTWVIIDYDTNTVSFDTKNGLQGATTEECIHTTDFSGNIITSIKSNDNKKELIVEASLKNAQIKPLDQRLWLEGNLSIAYGKNYNEEPQKAFSVIFDPDEVREGLYIENDSIKVESNTWYDGLYENTASQIVSFKYAQHFLSDSPGHYSNIMNRDELKQKHETIDFSEFPNYSTKPIKKMFKLGQITSLLLIIILTILLVYNLN